MARGSKLGGMEVQMSIKLRLFQADQVVLEVENIVLTSEMVLPVREEPIRYIPPPTTDVQTIELWYERESGEYSVPRTTF